ncbi:MAG TPA: formyltetrahydrofolate deformylase [Candidatus Bathyarchaeia archaeon]|nr:formyltetrahydrofolate deformylase [Candidatus Bathyarchaeia archaeon]
MSHAILLISCPDQKGITASVTRFVYENRGNIVHADQHIDDQSNIFFMRLEWDMEGFALSREESFDAFKTVAREFSMEWQLFFTEDTLKVAIFVSRHLHCLNDLLLRQKAGHLRCDIPLIISNHAEAQEVAKDFGIKFVHLPVTSENKAQQEIKQMALLKKHEISLVVLARYHQILSENFVEQFKNRIINIHHSFLPSFPGRQPYAQAYEKGVKLIGAPCHYVTANLDEGPIIEQDTIRVSHRDSLADLVRQGEDIEKAVLSRSLRWALEHKILCYNNKTVVFD